MDRERFIRVKTIVLEASGLPADRRKAFLDTACRDCPDLRTEAESLLAHDRESEGGSGRHGGVPDGKGDALVGTVVTHYRILDRLGEGGMGIVYRAEDLTLKRLVALKFAPVGVARNTDTMARIIREAQAAAALDDPRICTVYEVGEAEGRAFIAMALVEGETLQAMLGGGPLALLDALTVAIQVAEGLEAAHSAAVIHRDIKPGNIMRTRTGQIRILDFGIATGARPCDPAAAHEGTVAYMSPEQVSGHAVDHRTDLWSLGVVLFEMLTGQLPFDADNARAVAHRIQHDAPPPLLALRFDAPAALAAVVSRALAKDPANRYGSAGEMAAALRDVRDQLRARDGGTPNVAGRATEWKIPTDGCREAGENPGVRTGSSGGEPTRNLGARARSELPVPLASLIGRRSETLAVKRLLERNPVVAICGPAGIGKSRLAIQAASELVEVFQDGVFFIPLASLNSPSLVASRICATLGLALGGREDEASQLLGFLRERHILLVLDNADHVREASLLIERIIRSAPRVSVVITTAKQLGVPGEVPLVLRGLTYPASDRAGDASNYDAVRLFSRGVRRGEGAERASAQDQRRTGAVCRLLRGIPLAVELAAGWGSRALDRTTLWALRRRIRSCQHQSPWEEERILWVACERTLKMLPRDTRAVFVRLAMFRGGWREPAAVAVALAESDQLRALVDASLLRVTRSRRYEMHEALRAFALERLYRDKRESSRVFRRFCAYFATFVADRCGDSRGSDTSAALREMTEEIDSIRAAWSLAVERHDARTVGAFLPGLAAYYEARGLIHEAVRMFGRAVEAFESTAAASDRDGVHAEVQRLILAREEFSRRLG